MEAPGGCTGHSGCCQGAWAGGARSTLTPGAPGPPLPLSVGPPLSSEMKILPRLHEPHCKVERKAQESSQSNQIQPAPETSPCPFWTPGSSETHLSFERAHVHPETGQGAGSIGMHSFPGTPGPRKRGKGKQPRPLQETGPSLFTDPARGPIQSQLSFEPCHAETVATTEQERSFNSLPPPRPLFLMANTNRGHNRTTCNVLVIKKVTITKHFKL